MSEKRFLDKVHTIKTPQEARVLYDDWAETYEAEVFENGYITPARVTRALAAYSTSFDAPVLDYGCGTGLSGAALVQAGFTCVDGADLSSEMLQEARAKNLYRKVWLVDPDLPLGVTPGEYASIAAMGVIGRGAAGLGVFDRLFDALSPDGLMAFSFNDITLNDPAYAAHVHALADSGTAKLLFQEYGDHLPEKNIKSNVYILAKT